MPCWQTSCGAASRRPGSPSTCGSPPSRTRLPRQAARRSNLPAVASSALVDAHGNWVQMMNTLQSGGIPGEVLDGVPMVGSHGMTSLDAAIGGWFTGGGRMRSIIGNTIVLKDGRPWWSLGSPGNVHCTVPQVLSNVLDYGMTPYDAEDAPRMLPLENDYKLSIESRIPAAVIDGLADLGVLVDPLPAYDYHMGTFQMSWLGDNGTLYGSAGPRRAGEAA